MHLITSYRSVRTLNKVLKQVLPYSTMAENIDVNTRHLKSGDPLPPFTGKLRVYNMRFCPFAQRTILALNAKNLDYEVVNIDLVDKPEWLTEKSPFGKVPALEIEEGVTLCESLITAEYLDEVYPDRPLLPSDDPVKKALDKMLVEFVAPTLHAVFFKKVKCLDISDDNLSAYYMGLSHIQEELRSRGTAFLSGDEPGYADYMIWPWLERLLTFDSDERLTIQRPSCALLGMYIQRMLNDPAVSPYLVPRHILAQFQDSYSAGEPDYEILSHVSKLR